MFHYFQVLIVALMATRVVSQGWIDAHATFYGDGHGGQTNLGACGYDTFKEGYGVQTTALSETLFQQGSTCGSCYEIKCVNSQFCLPGAAPITVTATNLCPSTTGKDPWCNEPYKHFDLTMPMFLKIAQYKAGIVPVQFNRVPCSRQGGVRFQVSGKQGWLLVLVFNVAGDGEVSGMKVKGSGGDWVAMSRNWGMNWQDGKTWFGEGMSFQVTLSDGKMIQFDDVVPSTWQIGQSFEGKSNF